MAPRISNAAPRPVAPAKTEPAPAPAAPTTPAAPKRRKGLSDRFEAVPHAITSPRDHASGLPTGKRMHKPMVITKELDRAPQLLLNEGGKRVD